MPRTLLSAHGVVRRIGARPILSSVSLAVDDVSRVALVGPNGAGKSTLLRILAGIEEPDAGRVIRAHGVAVLYLPQLDAVAGARPIRTMLHGCLGVCAAAARMDALAGRLADGPDAAVAYDDALQDWLALGGPDVDARLDRAAGDAGLDPALLDRPGGALSGGERARAMLAAVAAARTDVLLLDEPANHLDDDGLDRLRSLLDARVGGLVIVAHDRELLAATTNRVAELDRHDGTLSEFGGGWAAHEAETGRARRRAGEAHDRAVAERDRLRARERAMRGRGAGAIRRSASENDRNVRHAMREGAQRSADGLAARMARRAERIEVPSAPWKSPPPALTYVAGGSRTGVIAALRGVVLRRGAFSVGPLDLELRDGDRVLLAGPNGAGKSTVIASLVGRAEPAGGTVHRVDGAIAEVGQEHTSLLEGAAPDVVSAVRAHAGIGEREARAALAAMGLDKALVAEAPSSLSPGERTRAELAAATAAGARLLVLDEPTNHLDLEALAALEHALEDWPGALLVATHDARLRENLRLDATLEL